MEMLDAFDAAAQEFQRRLERVDASQWADPTPCGEWDVHYLVAHVVGGHRFGAIIAAGQPFEAAIEVVMSQPQLGDDAAAAHATTAARLLECMGAPGALQREVSHPLGAMTGHDFLGLRVFDTTLHAWDLAMAIGDDTQLNPVLVDVVLRIVRERAAGMGFGIEPLGEVGPDASPQEHLLDLTGRRSTR